MENLIEIVRGFPELYDTSHEDYLKAKVKDELWENIARELNYTDAKAAKEQWRKLRECHREALRRQQKKSGQQTTNSKPWTYQKQMEFLTPFMKNKNTIGYPTSPLDESQLEEDAVTLSDLSSVEARNYGDSIEPSESTTFKKLKKSTITDPVMWEFLENSNKRARNEDELRQYLFEEKQKQEDLQNDALYHFFVSMFNITKSLPIKYQKQVRRKLFQAVSEAEDKAQDEAEVKAQDEAKDKAEDETEAKGEAEQNLAIFSQYPLSSTTHPTSIFSSGTTQHLSDIFSPSIYEFLNRRNRRQMRKMKR